MTETAQQILERIRKDVAENQRVAFVDGALGEMPDCMGVLELPVIMPPEGGTFIKFYGCDYLLKGFPERSVVEGLGLAKAMISAIPREVLGKNWLMIAGTILTFLFRRKKFIHDCHVWFNTIYVNEVAKIGIPPERYNKMTKELKRAAYKVMGKEPKDLLHGDFHLRNKEELNELIACIVEFLCVFIELDTAYRFRLQDGFMVLNKENVKKDVVKEIQRVADTMIKREHKDWGIAHKVEYASKLFLLFLRLSKQAREWVTKYLLELDIDQIKFDQDDWYFVLKRRGYDFGGWTLEDRLEERERIDRQHNHVMLKFRNNEHGTEIYV